MQPSAAISWARAMYWSWLPSQPCTSITPGTIVSGGDQRAVDVWPSTGMSIVLSRVGIGLDDAYFVERPARGSKPRK